MDTSKEFQPENRPATATLGRPEPRKPFQGRDVNVRPPRLGPPHNASPAWERETNKCIGREVNVEQLLGINASGLPVIAYYRGVCVAIQMQHLSVILMTESEKLLIKNVHVIRRVRSFNDKDKQPGVGALTEVLGDALAGAKE